MNALTTHKSQHCDTDSSSQDIQLDIIGAKCAGCVTKIEKALLSTEGVISASVNFANRSATIKGAASAKQLIASVQAAGYDAEEIINEEQAQQDREKRETAQYKQLLHRTWLALFLGLALMTWGLSGGSMMVSTPGQQLAWIIVGAITGLVMLYSGNHFYSGAWKALRVGQSNMDTLIALGTGSAWLFSMLVAILPSMFPTEAQHVYFEASAMIIGLVNFGQALEIRARGKTSAAIMHLLGLQPKTARVIKDGEEYEVSIADLQPGDIIKLRPGEKVPVDATITEGESFLDESMLTGEPLPVKRYKGDRIMAGTFNSSGSIWAEATHIGRKTLLAQIIQQVKQAQSSKPEIGQLADKVSAIFVPVVLCVALIAAILWFIFGPSPQVSYMLVAAMTVLIIACPCALGLATPMAIMMGVGKAAQLGVLIRNGDALQTSGQLDTLVLDKTGTITEGKPSVLSLMTAGRYDQDKLIRLAASLENDSEHPLAQAVVKDALHHHQELSPVTGFNSVAGRGVTGTVEGHRVVVGNALWLEDNQIDIKPVSRYCQAIAERGNTPVLVAIDGKAIGALGIGDKIKADSKAAIERLQNKGLHVIMLSGDREPTARAIADQIGISEVIAEVLPDEKGDVIRKLIAQGKKVGMVGDGINDAPALANATVGFAMGSGTDVAIESADIALMRSSLHGVADAMEISKATITNIKQNLIGAFAYNIIGIPVAAGILFPFTGTLLNPVIAGAAMSLSSLTVVSNASRLRWFKPRFKYQQPPK